MGQYSLIAVVGAFLLSAVVLFNASNSSANAEEKVWEHQYHVISRDAASTGMSATTRRLADKLNSAWDASLAASLGKNNVAYDDGRYTVTASASATGCSLLTPANFASAVSQNGFIIDGQVIEVHARGNYDGAIGSDADGLQSHEIAACFVKADYGLFSSPAFNFGFISEDAFTFNGGADIQALVDGQGHVHSNNSMTLGPQVDIDGVVTYVGKDAIHKNAQIGGEAKGVDIPMKYFDVEKFKADEGGITATVCTNYPNKCKFSTGGFTSSGNATIQPPTADVGHRKDDPFIWFVDGNFTLSGSHHIKVPQYTTIVVTGNISVSGTSAVTVTGKTMYDLYGTNPTPEQQRNWVVSQLFDGQHSPLAWYAGSLKTDGTPNPTTGNVKINGTSALVGNFYVNGDVELDGGGQGNNTVGSFASTAGDVTANGGGKGGNFWFLEVAKENEINSVKLPGKQIVRLAMAEWTDPVLDN